MESESLENGFDELTRLSQQFKKHEHESTQREKQVLSQSESAWWLNANIYESAVRVSEEASKYIGTL